MIENLWNIIETNLHYFPFDIRPYGNKSHTPGVVLLSFTIPVVFLNK